METMDITQSKPVAQRSLLHSLDDAYLSQILQLHLNKETGSLYWIKRAADRQLRLNDLQTFEDYKELFAFKSREDQVLYEQHLRELPIEEFIPGSTLQKAKWLWASETGGTTGIAKRGTWGDAYWKQIIYFSDEFLDLHGVPWNENWLFIGPTGPHTTGRLMVSIAEHRGGRIFCIDLDPRIVRVYLQEGNIEGMERYVKHIWEQVEPIIKYQNVGVMFCTATLLEMLPKHLNISYLDKIKAVVHAGLAMSRDTHQYLREKLFVGKPIVGIYGTSVSGISYQKPYEAADEHRVIYIPCQPHIVLDVIDEAGNQVNYDEEGDLRCFRFTEDQLIPGFVERDRATRIKPFGEFAERYPWDWTGDPHSPLSISGQKMEGVY